MNGKEILVDTNILIKLLAGDDTLADFLQGKLLYISFVRELEMYGLRNPSKDYFNQCKRLLSDCFILPLNDDIKNGDIDIRQKTSLKLPDAIIAATALSVKFPLLSADDVFIGVNKINFMYYEV
jgi:predicted nucleic acid-binding protein